MRRCTMLWAAVISATLGFSAVGEAAPPPMINFQGILRDGVGAPVANGPYFATFRLYNAPAGGTALWADTQTVTTSAGLFNALLGVNVAIPDSALGDTACWLGVTVFPDAELAPRTKIASVGYSYRVYTVHDAQGGTIHNKVTIGPGHTNSGAYAFVAGASNTAMGDTSVIAGGHKNITLGTNSAILGGNLNEANAWLSTVVGGYKNTATAIGGAVVGGSNNIAGGPVNSFVGGGNANLADGPDAVVAGGLANSASWDQAAVVAGQDNHAVAPQAFVGGGFQNRADGANASVLGGQGNRASSDQASVAGGALNYAGGFNSFVGGGRGDTALAAYSTIGGGARNKATGDYSIVAGGESGQATALSASVGGGYGNIATNIYAVVAGGFLDTASGINAAVGGGRFNHASGDGAAIAGGTQNRAVGVNSVIAGGYLNVAGAENASIVGGYNNYAAANESFVGGGISNAALGLQSTLGGGLGDTASGGGSTVGGGWYNRSSGTASTVAGGHFNHAAGFHSTVGGGQRDTASGSFSTVAGGTFNAATGASSTVGGGELNRASGSHAVVSGGIRNIAVGSYSVVSGGGGLATSDSNRAVGDWSTVPGGRANWAVGSYSSAAGRRARANHAGTFVWADSTDADFASTATGQFLVRATSVGLGTNAPVNKLDVEGAAVIGVTYSGTNTAPANGLLVQGPVGINTTTVSGGVLLDVKRNGGAVALFDRLGTDGDIVNFGNDGVVSGSISVAGGAVSYNAFTGSHYGWTSEPMERGVLVSFTGENVYHHGRPESEVIYGITESSRINDPACLGAYLGLSESAVPASEGNPHLVMAVGNGIMWVVESEAGIEPGDYLIASGVSGHAMKDDPARFAVGHIVARAAERVDWSTITDTVGGRKHKQISVLFGNFVRSNTEALEQSIRTLEKRLQQLETESMRAELP